MMKDFPIIGDVRGRGLMIGLELVKDQKTKAYATEETVRLMDLCKDRGLLVGKGGLYGNVVRIAPPLSINNEEVNTLLKTMGEAFKALH
jgi:4-aminobutyrate aminotransferase-like enzyme